MYKSLTKKFEGYLSSSRKDKFTKKDGPLSHFYIKPHILGQAPHPRFSHHTTYLPNKGYLVIYGGRNDEMYETSSQAVLSDINILNVRFMCWCKVAIPKNLRKYNAGPRYGGAMVYDSKNIFKNLFLIPFRHF